MTKHESFQYPAALQNKRVEQMQTLEIKTSPEKIFPLACPVEEQRWIPNWEYQLVYSKSGVNENNCIFREDLSGPVLFDRPLTTTWVTTLHDPEKFKVQFLLILEDKAVIKWEFNCREIGKNKSAATWHLAFTALDEEANKMTNEEIKEKLTIIMSFLSAALQSYCETGEMISQ